MRLNLELALIVGLMFVFVLLIDQAFHAFNG